MGKEKIDELIYRVIGCMIAVHKELGPGFLEKIYRRAVEIEFTEQGLRFESEKKIKVCYRDRPIGIHRLDLLVEEELVVELKALEELHVRHYAQVRSYLRAMKKRVGLLVNFAVCPVDCRRVEADG